MNPLITSFIQFVQNQPEDREIAHGGWFQCAVGDWASHVNGDAWEYGKLLDALRVEAPHLHFLLNWGEQFADDDAEYSYAEVRIMERREGQKLEDRLYYMHDDERGLISCKPETVINTYGDLQVCLIKLFPELLIK